MGNSNVTVTTTTAIESVSIDQANSMLSLREQFEHKEENQRSFNQQNQQNHQIERNQRQLNNHQNNQASRTFAAKNKSQFLQPPSSIESPVQSPTPPRFISQTFDYNNLNVNFNFLDKQQSSQDHQDSMIPIKKKLLKKENQGSMNAPIIGSANSQKSAFQLKEERFQQSYNQSFGHFSQLPVEDHQGDHPEEEEEFPHQGIQSLFNEEQDYHNYHNSLEPNSNKTLSQLPLQSNQQHHQINGTNSNSIANNGRFVKSSLSNRSSSQLNTVHEHQHDMNINASNVDFDATHGEDDWFGEVISPSFNHNPVNSNNYPGRKTMDNRFGSPLVDYDLKDEEIQLKNREPFPRPNNIPQQVSGQKGGQNVPLVLTNVDEVDDLLEHSFTDDFIDDMSLVGSKLSLFDAKADTDEVIKELDRLIEEPGSETDNDLYYRKRGQSWSNWDTGGVVDLRGKESSLSTLSGPMVPTTSEKALEEKPKSQTAPEARKYDSAIEWLAKQQGIDVDSDDWKQSEMSLKYGQGHGQGHGHQETGNLSKSKNLKMTTDGNLPGCISSAQSIREGNEEGDVATKIKYDDLDEQLINSIESQFVA